MSNKKQRKAHERKISAVNRETVRGEKTLRNGIVRERKARELLSRENEPRENEPRSPREIPEALRGKTFLDAKYGPAFRALLSEDEAIRDFLNSILRLEPGRRIKTLEYTFEDPLDFRTPERKTLIFDVHAWTEDHRCLDIELQRATHSFFIDRVLLYSAFLAIKGRQKLENSPEFKSLDEKERLYRRYELPEVISIWLCNFHLLGKGRDYHDEWKLYSQSDLARKKIVSVSEKLRYILVDLPEFARVCKNPESNEAKWLYLVAKAGDEEVLPDFGDPVFERAADRIRVNSASDELLRRQAKEMVTQDEIDVRLVDAERLGLEKGMKSVARKMLAKGSPLSEIADITGLSEKEIRALKKS